MDIMLPPKANGEQEKVSSGTRRLIIIGANGSGKTRFTEYLINELSGRAFSLSALYALFDTRHTDTLPGSVDMLYDEALTGSGLISRDNTTRFERLIALLMHEEVLNLISYKVESSSGSSAGLKSTKLDKVIEMWRRIFPGNRVLIEGGRLLISNSSANAGSQAYSSVKLSAGEKAVMYYFAAVLYAMENAVIFVDNPGMFLHPSIMNTVWDYLEELRPDCTFVYTTHDLDFASSRTDNAVVWVRDYDAASVTWDYNVLPPHAGLSDDIYLAIIGARKPVLFIEGDGVHSIDSKLYPLIFTEYTVKSLGSCNKVIEATRAFNDLTAFHHLDSHGIVDRDRRDAKEVRYLRDKKIFVPDVAEIENILMLEEVVRTVARRHGQDENRVFSKVKAAILAQFRQDIRQQALLHTRHRVKRTLEYRVDGRFNNINMLEEHLNDLAREINPRGMYEDFCREFHRYVDTGDYQSVLRVYNQKSMLVTSNVSSLCGVGNKEQYIRAVINILKGDGRDASRIRRAVMRCFGIGDTVPERGDNR
ncbi:MAG: DUF4435 domain-containing protein [Muribaculaceae bacterium]|nr:DUF4435 domain-containing protein [Muribaculaceae bacterium]